VTNELNKIGAGPTGHAAALGGIRRAVDDKSSEGPDFKNMLLGSIEQVNQLRNESEAAIEKLATGQTENVAEVFTAVRKADMAYSMLMEVKNRMLDAYTELRQLRL
jgi:flagellar hook-basal body complex protein FliE